MNTPVVFQGITDVDSKSFEDAMRIYIDSFPEKERQPVEVLRKRLREGNSTFHREFAR